MAPGWVTCACIAYLFGLLALILCSNCSNTINIVLTAIGGHMLNYFLNLGGSLKLAWYPPRMVLAFHPPPWLCTPLFTPTTNPLSFLLFGGLLGWLGNLPSCNYITTITYFMLLVYQPTLLPHTVSSQHTNGTEGFSLPRSHLHVRIGVVQGAIHDSFYCTLPCCNNYLMKQDIYHSAKCTYHRCYCLWYIDMLVKQRL